MRVMPDKRSLQLANSHGLGGDPLLNKNPGAYSGTGIFAIYALFLGQLYQRSSYAR